MKTLGDCIRELREERDLSVRELAKKIKKSAPFLSDVELGRRHPSEDVLKTIASFLGTTFEELQKHDARAPVQELRRIAANNPAMGFALRQAADDPEAFLEFLKNRTRSKKR
jgi:transcriptional regulator with XRE-family HTH domain